MEICFTRTIRYRVDFGDPEVDQWLVGFMEPEQYDELHDEALDADTWSDGCRERLASWLIDSETEDFVEAVDDSGAVGIEVYQ